MFYVSKIRLVEQNIFVRGAKNPIPINDVKEISITSKRKIRFYLINKTILIYKVTLITKDFKTYSICFYKDNFHKMMKLKNHIKNLANGIT